MSTGGKKGGTQPERTSSKRPGAPGEGPSRTVRILASFVLALHVLVLFLYPWANSRTSDTIQAIAQWPGLRWYADPLYLNHGYGFFGPDPGASFLIEYQVRDASGEIIAEEVFPDLNRLWPRLRYHRYKMLADQLEAPQFEPAIARERKEYMLTRYAHQLIRLYDGESVTVSQVMHSILPYYEWLGDEEQGIKGKQLTDKSTYRTLTTITQTRADVEAADAKLLGTSDQQPATEQPSETIPIGRQQ